MDGGAAGNDDAVPGMDSSADSAMLVTMAEAPPASVALVSRAPAAGSTAAPLVVPGDGAGALRVPPELLVAALAMDRLEPTVPPPPAPEMWCGCSGGAGTLAGDADGEAAVMAGAGSEAPTTPRSMRAKRV